jgi:membrane protein involved in colicin uptake
MSRGSADKTYAKRKRQPYETSTRERAYQIAAREAVSGSGSRGKATPRRGRGGNLSGGRGSGSTAHVEDNGGTEGKTIPIELKDDMLLGEIDSTYQKYHKALLKRRPPTKCDN